MFIGKVNIITDHNNQEETFVCDDDDRNRCPVCAEIVPWRTSATNYTWRSEAEAIIPIAVGNPGSPKYFS